MYRRLRRHTDQDAALAHHRLRPAPSAHRSRSKYGGPNARWPYKNGTTLAKPNIPKDDVVAFSDTIRKYRCVWYMETSGYNSLNGSAGSARRYGSSRGAAGGGRPASARPCPATGYFDCELPRVRWMMEDSLIFPDSYLRRRPGRQRNRNFHTRHHRQPYGGCQSARL